MNGAALVPRKRCGSRRLGGTIFGLLVVLTPAVARSDDSSQSAGAEVQIARPYADLHGSSLADFHALVSPLLAE